MENLTYREYCENPRVRKQLDAEVRRLQREAFDQYIFAPLIRMCRRMLRRARPAPAQTAAKPARYSTGAPT